MDDDGNGHAFELAVSAPGELWVPWDDGLWHGWLMR